MAQKVSQVKTGGTHSHEALYKQREMPTHKKGEGKVLTLQ